jgi:hypothetical protein
MDRNPEDCDAMIWPKRDQFQWGEAAEINDGMNGGNGCEHCSPQEIPEKVLSVAITCKSGTSLF